MVHLLVGYDRYACITSRDTILPICEPKGRKKIKPGHFGNPASETLGYPPLAGHDPRHVRFTDTHLFRNRPGGNPRHFDQIAQIGGLDIGRFSHVTDYIPVCEVAQVPYSLTGMEWGRAVKHVTFGVWLRREIRRAGINQTELARRVGTSGGTVSMWAHDQRVPDPGSCDRIADALGVDLDLVLFYAGHRPLTTPPDPDDPKINVQGLVDRVNWKRARPGDYEVVTTVLRSIIKEQRGEYK